MHELIKKLFFSKLKNPILAKLTDSAVAELKTKKFAFTTDSFVVNPLFFRGGDIGKLAICGTLNDLVMQGALPRFISLALIIEEGLDYAVLEKIIDSIATQLRQEKVQVVTGDLKVVERGACDKIFINTSGIGALLKKQELSLDYLKAGDLVILTGGIGEHGLSVLAGRDGLDFAIKSDCAALGGMLLPIFRNSEEIKFMRDPTRGGLATTLNEIAQGANLGIAIEEQKIPILDKVQAACALLGIDPLYVANEGKAVLVVKAKGAKKILRLLKKHRLGRQSRIIGEIINSPKKIVLCKTLLGTTRLIEMLEGEVLPRIC